MLTTKQLARNVYKTYCSTSNTFFTHDSTVKPAEVCTQTCSIKRNPTAEAVAQFLALPSLYLLKK